VVVFHFANDVTELFQVILCNILSKEGFFPAVEDKFCGFDVIFVPFLSHVLSSEQNH
jgi:hypothetical protein